MPLVCRAGLATPNERGLLRECMLLYSRHWELKCVSECGYMRRLPSVSLLGFVPTCANRVRPVKVDQICMRVEFLDFGSVGQGDWSIRSHGANVVPTTIELEELEMRLRPRRNTRGISEVNWRDYFG